MHYVVYRYACSKYNATYYGKTCRHSFTRAAGYVGIFNITKKRVKIVKKPVDHHLQCGYLIDFDRLLKKA